MCQQAQYQDPGIKAAKWNSAVVNFIIFTDALPSDMTKWVYLSFLCPSNKSVHCPIWTSTQPECKLTQIAEFKKKKKHVINRFRAHSHKYFHVSYHGQTQSVRYIDFLYWQCQNYIKSSNLQIENIKYIGINISPILSELQLHPSTQKNRRWPQTLHQAPTYSHWVHCYS